MKDIFFVIGNVEKCRYIFIWKEGVIKYNRNNYGEESTCNFF